MLQELKSLAGGKGIPTNVLSAESLWGAGTVDKENAKTRNGLRSIGSVKDFETLLERTMLSEEEKEILRLHYRDQRTLSYIADSLGMSEASIKKKHKKILMKIGKLF